MRWNAGVSFPIGSGHPCIGCSEDSHWDNGPFYARLQGVRELGAEANADTIGGAAAATVGVAIAAHAGISALSRVRLGAQSETTDAIRGTRGPSRNAFAACARERTL